MKQLILSVFVVFCALQPALTQDVEVASTSILTTPKKTKKIRYSGLAEVMPHFGLHHWGENVTPHFAAHGVCINTVHGIQLIDKYFLGMGIGLNIVADLAFVPVFFNFRLDFSNEQTKPFMSTSVGMQFGGIINNHFINSYQEQSFGVWSNIMFGLYFKNRWYAAAGLSLQNAKYDWQDITINRNDSKEIFGICGIIGSLGIKF